MDNNHLTHQLHIMASAVITMEQELHRLDIIELEILSVKSTYNAQLTVCRNAICTLLGGMKSDADFADLYYECSHTPISYFNNPTPINYQGNGFGNQSTPKTSKEIIKEIQDMIVELKIKGSVRERANGLIEFRSQAL